MNGDAHEVPSAASLAGVLERLGLGGLWSQRRSNGEFVASAARGEITLCEGDRVEVLAPMQGG